MKAGEITSGSHIPQGMLSAEFQPQSSTKFTCEIEELASTGFPMAANANPDEVFISIISMNTEREAIISPKILEPTVEHTTASSTSTEKCGFKPKR